MTCQTGGSNRCFSTPSSAAHNVTDPDLFARLLRFPFIQDGRVILRNRGGGFSLFDATLDQPIVRIRPTGLGDQVVLLYPDPKGGWMPPGTLGDTPLSLDQALQEVENAIVFLDHIANAKTVHRVAVRRRTPL